MKPYKPTKKDLKEARKAYRKLNKIPHQPTATELSLNFMSNTRAEVLSLETMMFLGYSVDSWLNLWSSLRANLNEEDPNKLAKIINIRGLK